MTRGGWTSSGEWVPVPYVDERAAEAARILRAAFGMARSASGDSSLPWSKVAPPTDDDSRTGQGLEAETRAEVEPDAVRSLVGYNQDNPPYSFFNARDDLVGFDVEMAHDLARTLGTALEFVPVLFSEVGQSMEDRCCDLIMSGVIVTPERAEEVAFSQSYLEEHLAFVVADHDRSRYADRESVRRASGLRLGVVRTSGVVDRVRRYFPEAEVRELESFEELEPFLEGRHPDLDALVVSAERGAVWSLRYPRLAVVVPNPPLMTTPLAYVVAERDGPLWLFVNTWIDLRQRDGTIGELQDYWVYGKDAEPRAPRWSVIRNVLGWVE